MISKQQKVRLGAFLVISFLVLAVSMAILVIPKLKEKGDVYFINFKGTSVNGISEGAPVKYQGVEIGKVIHLEVNPKNLNSVLIYVRIKSGFPVKVDMGAVLQYAGITGLRFIEISGGKDRSSFVLPGGEIKTKKGLGEKAEDIVLNVDSVVKAVNDMLNAQNREKFALLIKNLETSTRVIADTLEKRQSSFTGTIDKLDRSMTHILELSKNLKTLSAHMNNVSQKVSFENLAKESENLLKNISERFSEKEMGKVLKRLDSFLVTAGSSLRKVETNFQNLHEEFRLTLVRLRESMENISRFTREVSEDPTMLIRKKSAKKRGKK